MANLIACRILSYGKYQHRAWAHLPSIGIRNVEMPIPPADQKADVRKKLADNGLRVTSLQSLCDVTLPDAVDIMRPQLEACVEFGANYCFLSAKAKETDRAIVHDRLRAIGEAAKSLGVTVVLETHPDLVTNGDVGRQTMRAVNHPNVRINYDTANVYFYNRDVTAVGEMAKLIDDIASVHLKDSTGKFEEWVFPTLGTGVVDFPEIFR
ncbi:MAG TPA: sugar phosphate isomerase/epimerase family protein, partial [Phycisphaerae bacterium]|nr:sugar phosphate isomerase/epimerase family protein [Phycisphaerae bacterium]